MRPVILRAVVACLLLAALPAGAAVAQEAAAKKTHIFLVDVSLSMDSKVHSRYTGLREWLVQPLLRSGAFARGDKVIVRWFHERAANATAFQAQDGERKVNLADYDEGAVLDSIPSAGQAYGRNTNIPQALDLVLSDISGYQIGGDVLIWLLTDNFQESGLETTGAGANDIKPLYQRITENRNFRAAYLFPLVNENNAGPGPKGEAMILYLLHYSPQASLLPMDELAGAVSKQIKNPVITWFPVGKKVIPEPVPTDDGETQMNGDAWVLPSVREGHSPNFDNIKFYLKSKLQSRAITGRIRPNSQIEINWPSTLLVEGQTQAAEAAEAETPQGEDGAGTMPATSAAPETGRWEVSVSPADLSLGPGMRSKNFYTAAAASHVVLRPDGFFTGLWNSESEPVSGTLSFDIENIRADVQVDDSALDRVANKDVIRQIISQSIRAANSQGGPNNRTFFLPVQFRVAYDSTWRWACVGVAAGLLLALGLAVALLLLVKTRYELTAGRDTRVVSLPLVGSAYVSVNGSRAAVISRRFNRVTIKPLTNFLVDGTPGVRTLAERGESFMVTSHEDGKNYPYAWDRVGKQPAVSDSPDSFYD